MFPSISILSALALATFAALAPSSSARPIPHSIRLYRRFTFVAQPTPAGWSGTFEDYDSYHFRYLAVSCHTQHDSSFFKACCHPRRKFKTDADYPAQCSLSAGSVASAAKIVEESLNGKDSAGKGKAVYVQKGTVTPMKAIKVGGGDSTRPPTEEQLHAVAEAEAALTSSSSKPNPKPDHKPAVMMSSASSSSSTPSSSKSPHKDSQPSTMTKTTSATPTPMVSSTYNWGSAATVSSSKAAAAAAASASAAAAQHAAEEAQQKAAASASSASVKAAQATQTSSSGSSSSGSASSLLPGVSSVFGQSGNAQGTFFYQNGVAGACGTVHSDSTPLVALETTMYANGAHCGRKVLIKNTQTGAEVTATVQDECPTCATADSLDMSTAAFNQIGQEAQGVLPIVWGFLD